MGCVSLSYCLYCALLTFRTICVVLFSLPEAKYLEEGTENDDSIKQFSFEEQLNKVGTSHSGRGVMEWRRFEKF